MIQDIAPRALDNTMRFPVPRGGDTVLVFSERTALVGACSPGISLPTVSDIQHTPDPTLIYAFAIDGQRFFLALGPECDGPGKPEGFAFRRISHLRGLGPRHLGFALFTGYHLYRWYRDTRHCGSCGAPMRPSTLERSLICTSCGHKTYPTISPAVIVAVTDGSRILMSRYAGREYTAHALIAGYCEIGETAEETVSREVMEETGLRVRNIRYYKSQPWGQDGNLLLGYFCELEGSPELTVDHDELASAEWVERSEMDETDDRVSLTREMMACFKERRLPYL